MIADGVSIIQGGEVLIDYRKFRPATEAASIPGKLSS